MAKAWRVYSDPSGQSKIAELPLDMKPFVDTEGAHGQGTAVQRATSIAFRVSPPGYVLDWHCAPRRQYSISLSGHAEIEVGDGTVARIGPGDIVLAEDLTGQGHITRVVGSEPRFYAIVPLSDAQRILETIRSVPPLISFDIDGTLEVGDPPGLISVEMLRQCKQLGYVIGSCSDRPVSYQRQLWERLEIAADFTVLKHRLADVKFEFRAEAYFHIGDTELDHFFAGEAGFHFFRADAAMLETWGPALFLGPS